MDLTFFTVEEENLICVFNTDTRLTLITDINTAIPRFEEPELCALAQTTLRKLESLTDTEFAQLNFCPAYGFCEEAEG